MKIIFDSSSTVRQLAALHSKMVRGKRPATCRELKFAVYVNQTGPEIFWTPSGYARTCGINGMGWVRLWGNLQNCWLGFWQQYCASCVRCIVSACVSLAIVMRDVCNTVAVGFVEWKIKTLANWVYLSWSKQAIKHIDCYHSVSFHYYTMIHTDVSWSPCQMR